MGQGPGYGARGAFETALRLGGMACIRGIKHFTSIHLNKSETLAL